MDVFTDIQIMILLTLLIVLKVFLKKCQVKIRKYIYIGDFNIDLLKLDKINNYQLYYNLLCSFGFLPLIIQPTWVVENQTPSLIDNIFTNNLLDDIISGNIYLTLSEHFCQFASVKREKIDIKTLVFTPEIILNFHLMITLMMFQFKLGSMI